MTTTDFKIGDRVTLRANFGGHAPGLTKGIIYIVGGVEGVDSDIVLEQDLGGNFNDDRLVLIDPATNKMVPSRSYPRAWMEYVGTKVEATVRGAVQAALATATVATMEDLITSTVMSHLNANHNIN